MEEEKEKIKPDTDFENSRSYAYIRDKILDYLTARDQSEQKLLQKVTDLKRRFPQTKRYEGYTAENVLYVIERLKNLGVIDEVRFLRNMIDSSLSGIYGMRRVQQKMYKNGYKKKNITFVLKEHRESKAEHDLSKIIGLTKRKKIHLQEKYPNSSEYDIRNRLVQFLAQKGFTYDQIKEIIEMAA